MTIDLAATLNGLTIQTTFLSLPSEILTQIVEYLAREDRTNLSKTNNRLRDIERKAGYQLYIRIVFTMSAEYRITADAFSGTYWNNEMFPGGQIASSFTHATTEMLRIRGELDNETEEKLRMLLKTLTIHSLDFEITSEKSCRLFEEIVRNRKGIKKFFIQTNFANSIVEDKRLRQMILDLPAAEEYHIAPSKNVWHNQTVFDDNVLDHLIVSSVNFSFDFCKRPSVTAAGVEKAFARIRGKKKQQRNFTFPASYNALERFLMLLDRAVYISELHGDTTTVVHRKSGASCNLEHARVIGNDTNVHFVRINYTPKHMNK